MSRVLPFFEAAALVGVLYVSGVGGSAVNSLLNNESRIATNNARAEKSAVAYREMTFASVCPAYLGASWIGRNWTFRELGWCEAYRERV